MNDEDIMEMISKVIALFDEEDVKYINIPFLIEYLESLKEQKEQKKYIIRRK